MSGSKVEHSEMEVGSLEWQEQMDKRSDVVVIEGTYYFISGERDSNNRPELLSLNDGWIKHGYLLNDMNGDFCFADEEWETVARLPSFITNRTNAIAVLRFAGNWYSKGEDMGQFHKQQKIKTKLNLLLSEMGQEL